MPMLAALQALVARLDADQTLPDDEREWLSGVTCLDDLLDHPTDATGRWEALAYDAALALGATRWDAGSAAGDH